MSELLRGLDPETWALGRGAVGRDCLHHGEKISGMDAQLVALLWEVL